LTLLMEARSHGIDPRSIINGKEIFRLSDFGDAGILLRAAEPPAGTESSLLRPAGHIDSSPDSLLRVATAAPPLDDDPQ
jgi:hypothetical protein